MVAVQTKLFVLVLLLLPLGFTSAASWLVVNEPALCPGLPAALGIAVGSFSTIQAAVNAASNGDRIYVCPGVYNENVIVNKEVFLSTIFGSAVINAADPTQPVVDISASNVRIQQFEIRGANRVEAGRISIGIRGRSIRNLTVYANRVLANVYGVQCINCNNSEFSFNTVTPPEGVTLPAGAFGFWVLGDNVYISYNTVSHFITGFHFNLNNSRVTNNIARDSATSCIVGQGGPTSGEGEASTNLCGIHGFVFLTYNKNDSIANNIADNIHGTGFYFLNVVVLTQVANNVARNNFENGFATVFGEISGVTFTQNTAQNNLKSGFLIGVPDKYVNVRLMQNVATSNYYGFAASVSPSPLVASPTRLTFDSNSATSNFDGFHLYLNSRLVLLSVTRNTAEGNSRIGFYLGSTIYGLVDGNTATNNGQNGFQFSEIERVQITNNLATAAGLATAGFSFVNVPVTTNFISNNRASGRNSIGFDFFDSAATLSGENRVVSAPVEENFPNIMVRSGVDPREVVRTTLDTGLYADRNRIVTDHLTLFFKGTAPFWFKTRTAAASGVELDRCAGADFEKCKLVSFENVVRVAIENAGGNLYLGIFFDREAAAEFQDNELKLAYYNDGWIPLGGVAGDTVVDRAQGFVYFGPISGPRIGHFAVVGFKRRAPVMGAVIRAVSEPSVAVPIAVLLTIAGYLAYSKWYSSVKFKRKKRR